MPKRKATECRICKYAALASLVLPSTRAVLAPSGIPQINLDVLGSVGVVGDFAGLSFYDPQNPPSTYSPYVATLLSRRADGAIAKVGETNEGGQISTICLSQNGTVYVGGSFTSLGGVQVSNIGTYNASSRTFAAMGPGLDGSVSAIACNGTAVYAGGAFRGPVGASDGYTGNVAVWHPSNLSWTPPSFGGLNGPVATIQSSTNGSTLLFGGSFSASVSGSGNTTGGSAAATIASLGSALTPISFSGSQTNTTASPTTSQSGFTDPTSIFCPSGSDGPGETWLLADQQLGSFTVRTGQALKVKGLRLANTHWQGRGTANFSLTVFPNNELLPLTYNTVPNDISSPTTTCQDTCPLSYDQSLTYQDFIFPNNTYFEGFRINILGYYGEGAGLHLVQLLSEGSYAYAVAEDNRAACGVGIARSTQAQASTTGTWSETQAYSCIPGIPQDVLVASVQGGTSPSAAQSLTWTPYITRSDSYEVFMTTPGCVGEGTCDSRTNVTLSIEVPGITSDTVTIDQTNQDTIDSLIYSGPIRASDAANGGITVQMNLAQGGAASSGKSYRMIADLIYLIASNTTGNFSTLMGTGHGLFEWDQNRNLTATASASNGTSIDQLATRLSANASVLAITASQESQPVTFIGGRFTYTNGSQSSANVVAFANSSSLIAPNGGLNDAVASLVAIDGVLYAAGNFTSSQDGTVTNLGGLASWSYSTNASGWQALPMAARQGQVVELAPFNNGQNMSLALLTSGGAGLSVYEPWSLSWNAFDSGFFVGNISTFSPGSPGNATALSYLSGSILAAASTYAPGGALLSSRDSGIAQLAPLEITMATTQTSSSGSGASKRHVRRHAKALVRDLADLVVPRSPRVARQTPALNVTLPSAFEGSITSGTVVAGAFWNNGSDSVVILGGRFTSASGATNLGAYDQKTESLSPLPGISIDGTVSSLLIVNNVLWVGGNFTTSTGQTSLLLYDLSTRAPSSATAALTGYSSVAPVVSVIAQRPGSDNTIIVAGAFATISNVPCQSICSWDTKAQKWSTLGNGLYGAIGSATFAGSEYLLAAGSFFLGDQQASIAEYRFSDSTWSAVGSQNELPGPSSAIASNNRDVSNVFAAGQTEAGAPYLSRWNGSRWADLNNQTLQSGSAVQQLLFVPVTQDHPSNSVIEADRMLLVAGNLVINSTNVQCALFDGAQWHPYLIATSRNGSPGVMSQLIYSIVNFSAAGARHLATGLVILVSIAIGLGLVFLLVLIGVLIALARRRKTNQELLSDGDSSQSGSHHGPTSLLATVGAATAVLLDKKGEKRSGDNERALATPASFGSPDSVEDHEYEPDQTARVRFSFHAEHPGELTVSSGEDITIVEATDANWWLVQNSTNQRGLIPASYLA